MKKPTNNERNAGRPDKFKKGTVTKEVRKIVPEAEYDNIVQAIENISKPYLAK